MKFGKKLAEIALLGGSLWLLAACGGRSLGNNSSDSGISGTAGVVSTPSSDTTPPTVTTFTPANASTPAPNTTLVSVTFNEAIDTATVTASSFHVKSGGTCTGTEVSASAVVVTNSNQTFTITLTSALANSTQYSTCLTSAIKDVAGNSLVATQVAWTTTATADVTAPGDVTGIAVQPALTRLILTWTNPGAADYAAVRILRKTTNDIGAYNDATATVACGGEVAAPQTTCTDTGLTNGTTYYYKAFTRDAIPNYSATGANASGTPACGTIEDIKTTQASPTTNNSRYLLNNCTLPQVTVTSVHRDGSNMGFYVQQTQSGAGIFVFTGSTNPTTTLNLTPGDRITFAGGTWANLCVASFNRQLQIVKKTPGSVCDGSTTGYVADPFVTGDFTEGAANASYLANLGTVISGNATFSTDFVNGADGRLYVFTTTATITGAGDSSVFPASFGTSSTINIAKTALVSANLANSVQFTPGRAVMGRYNDSLELRMYGTGAGGTTNYDGITAGGGENGYAIKSLTYTTAPTISFFSPAANGGFNTGSTVVSVGFDQAMSTGTITGTSFKVVAGTDCSAAGLATTGGITNSNGQKTFSLTLTGGQLVDGNQYTTCITTAVQNTSSIALASAASASWRGSSLTSSFATFEAWDTANQPTGWVYGTPPSGGSGAAGSASGNITQDTTTPTEGARGANINTAATTGNGNVLSYASTGTPLAGACTRIAVWIRGTSNGTPDRAIAIQLHSAGGTNSNYCSIGNDQLATSIATATVIEPNSATYTNTNINTGGAWRVAVCRIDNLNGGSMDTFRIRFGNPAAYNLTFDAIQFLDSANNSCVPVDFTAPTVTTPVPASGATGIAFAPTASVTFDKAMNTGSVNTAYTVKETDCSGATVSTGTPTASNGNKTFTYTLANLKPSTVYANCVTTGATSSAGTALATAYSSSFTTGALTEPSGLSFTPGNSQLTITFTVGNGNGGVQIVRGAAGAAAPADCSSGTAVYSGSTSPQVETGLTNGQTYAYRVCTRHNTGAYLSAGITGTGTPTNADITAPANPGSPTYTAGNGQVTLGWTNPADGDFAGIKIVRADGTGTAPADCNSGTTVCTGTGCNANVTAGAAGLTYIDTGRTNGTQYAYRMCAYDGVPNMSAGVTGTATPSSGPTYLLQETFNYGATTQAITAATANWTAHSGAGTNAIQYSQSPLAMTGYCSGGGVGALTVQAATGEDVNRTYAAQTSGTMYFGALVRFTAIGNTTGDYFLHIGNGTTNFYSRVYAKNDGSGNIKFGIARTTDAAQYAAGTYNLNTTYLIVGKTDAYGTSGNSYLYVLTAATGTEPGSPDATSLTSATSIANYSAVFVRQGTAANMPAGKIGCITVGKSWAELFQ